MKCEQQVILIANFMPYHPPSTVIVRILMNISKLEGWDWRIQQASKYFHNVGGMRCKLVMKPSAK